MSVTLHNKGSGSASASSTLAFNHTVSSENNRILIVSVISDRTARLITSMTFNGVAMTYLLDSQDRTGLYTYYLVAPDTGTHEISITFNGSVANSGAVSFDFSNVDQVFPFNAYEPYLGTGSYGNDIITTNDGCYIMEFSAIEVSLVALSNYSVNAGQTLEHKVQINSADFLFASQEGVQNAGTYNLGWTENYAFEDAEYFQNIIAINVAGNSYVNITDDITITESTGFFIDTKNINVSEQISVVENRTIKRDGVISVIDTRTISESVVMAIDRLISVNENLGIVDSIVEINRGDKNINVGEDVSIVEDVHISNEFNINTFESVSIEDAIGDTGPGADPVFIWESLEVELESVLHPEISISDNISITESIDAFIDIFNVSVFDTVSAIEDISITNELGSINVIDTISITELISSSSEIGGINTFDTIGISENIEVSNLLGGIEISDDVTIAENVSITNTELGGISVIDIVSNTESIDITNTELGAINVYSSITISEDISTELETEGITLINMNDHLVWGIRITS